MKINRFLIVILIILLTIGISCKTNELAFPVSTQDINKEYKKSKKKADKIYLYKELEVIGTLKEVYKNKKNEVVIIISSENDEKGIYCTLENSEQQIKTPLKLNQNIKIKGFCIGMEKYIELKKCQILEK